MWHADLFYRGSVLANLLPVEVVTKTGSLSTLSLSQTVPRTEWAFSSQSLRTQSSYKDHHKIGVSCLNYKWVWSQWRIKERRKQSKRKSSKEHNKSLSLITKAFVWNWERIWSLGCVLYWMSSSCKWLEVGKLGWFECGVVGAINTPTPPHSSHPNFPPLNHLQELGIQYKTHPSDQILSQLHTRL